MEIQWALARAKVAILLISTDFLASDFITTNELPPLLKAERENGAVIIPVLLKPCVFNEHPELKEFQAINSPEKPLMGLGEVEQEENLVKLVKRVMEVMR